MKFKKFKVVGFRPRMDQRLAAQLRQIAVWDYLAKSRAGTERREAYWQKCCWVRRSLLDFDRHWHVCRVEIDGVPHYEFTCRYGLPSYQEDYRRYRVHLPVDFVERQGRWYDLWCDIELTLERYGNHRLPVTIRQCNPWPEDPSAHRPRAAATVEPIPV